MRTATQYNAKTWGICGAVLFAVAYLGAFLLSFAVSILRIPVYGALIPPIWILQGLGLFGGDSAQFLLRYLFVAFLFAGIIEIPGLGYLAGWSLRKLLIHD